MSQEQTRQNTMLATTPLSLPTQQAKQRNRLVRLLDAATSSGASYHADSARRVCAFVQSGDIEASGTVWRDGLEVAPWLTLAGQEQKSKEETAMDAKAERCHRENEAKKAALARKSTVVPEDADLPDRAQLPGGRFRGIC